MNISYAARRRVFALTLLAPATAIIVAVLLYPLIDAIRLSFYHVRLGGTQELPAGLENYKELISGPAVASVFSTALINSLVFTFASMALAAGAGVAIALLLNEKVPGRAQFRTLFLFPWIIPWVSVSLLFMWLMDPNWGPVNYVLVALGLTNKGIAWFGSQVTAMPVLILMNTWKLTPFMTVSALAALQTIPAELTDAARIDGAGARAEFQHVVLPHIRPVLAVATLVAVVWGLQAFTPFWLITRGGPGYATETLSLYLYKKAFYEFDFGLATAVGTVWLLLVLGIGLFWMRVVWTRD